MQEFNEWYNKEHLPELLSVLGILSAAHYEAVKGGPQYLACYELESVAVMQTPAFTNRPRTPWGQKVSPSVTALQVKLRLNAAGRNGWSGRCRGPPLAGASQASSAAPLPR